MKAFRHKTLAFSLAGCVVFVGEVFAGQSPAHAVHHAHHKSATHVSLLCSWMCAAGQVDATTHFFFETPSSIGTDSEPHPFFLPPQIFIRLFSLALLLFPDPVH